MSSIKLSKIFESILGNQMDLNSYPYLKKLVDKYSRMKKNGQPIISPDDFDTLSNMKDPLTVKLLNVMIQQKYSDTVNSTNFGIPENTPQGRIYNIGKNLFINYSKNKPTPFSTNNDDNNLLLDATSDINEFVKNAFNLLRNSNATSQQPEQEPQNEPEQEPASQNPENDSDRTDILSNTKYLRGLAYVNIGNDQQIHITNEMLKSFQHADTDETVKKYYNAIWNNDMSLPDDFNTDSGLVYTLYKNLRNECSGLINSLNRVKHNMGYNINGNNASRESYSETEVEFLEFDKLRSNSSKVRFTYYLLQKDGKGFYNNTKKLYKGIFLYSPLTHVHRFINIGSKNNQFIFLKHNQGVEKGRLYPVKYSIIDHTIAHSLVMDIRLMELITGVNDSSSSNFDTCSALDELIDILTDQINGDR